MIGRIFPPPFPVGHPRCGTMKEQAWYYERTQKDYLTSAKIHGKCRVSFLRSFISCLVSVLFQGPSLLEMKFCRNFFPQQTRAFSAKLNGLQVHQVDRENDKQSSTYTQLDPSKSITACNTHIHYSGCGLTIHATSTQLLHEKPKNCSNENVKHLGDNFEAITHQ